MRDITERKRMQAAGRELEQNRRLTQLIQAKLEEERRSIARELHDELGQCVTAIKSISTAIANRTERDAPETHANAKTIASVATHIYDVVHGIIRQLRPSALDHLGLGETISGAVASWKERHPEVECDLQLSGMLEGLDEAINITVYRIVQECLTNVARHANARRAQISVRRTGQGTNADAVVVTVQDDGKGIANPDDVQQGRFGLIGMRERVQGFGGSLEISGDAGKGLSVRAVIPLLPTARKAQVEAQLDG
jgi:two-component system, NarL family, sensor histidine kinase UhpB